MKIQGRTFIISGGFVSLSIFICSAIPAPLTLHFSYSNLRPSRYTAH